jgi:RND family efflux transporter MFP subunit
LAGCGRGGQTNEAPGKDEEPKAEPVAVEIVPATVRSMATTIHTQGTLAPAQGASARVAVVAAGRLLAVRVREGDRVATAQVLAIVDSRPQEAQAASAAAALAAAETQARQADLATRAAAADQASAEHLARLALEAARLDRDTTVKQAQIALNGAETELAKLRAGARPQEIAQADQAISQAKATRDRAATELDRVQFLNEKGIAPGRQLDDAKTALAVADSALASAKEQASLVRAGTRPEDLRSAELRVNGAREALAQAQTSGGAKVAQAQAALQQAQQGVMQVAVRRQEALAMRQTAVQKRADLSGARTVAGYAELRSPLNGLVTRRSLNPGDLADPATPVVEVTDTRTLNLLGSLPAEEGTKVRTGMPVRVAAGEAPGRSYAGRVVSVGQVDPATNLLTVRVAVTNPGQTLKVGAFATAEIILRTNPRAIVVPNAAVVNKEGKLVVFVVGGDNVAHQREVTTGAEQGDVIEIVGGIMPDARVIRLGQYELSDGAKVKAAAAGGEKAGEP